jgi:hypothetical protein
LDKVVRSLEYLQSCYPYKAPKSTALRSHMPTEDKETISVSVSPCVCVFLKALSYREVEIFRRSETYAKLVVKPYSYSKVEMFRQSET